MFFLESFHKLCIAAYLQRRFFARFLWNSSSKNHRSGILAALLSGGQSVVIKRARWSRPQQFIYSSLCIMCCSLCVNEHMTLPLPILTSAFCGEDDFWFFCALFYDFISSLCFCSGFVFFVSGKLLLILLFCVLSIGEWKFCISNYSRQFFE